MVIEYFPNFSRREPGMFFDEHDNLVILVPDDFKEDYINGEWVPALPRIRSELKQLNGWQERQDYLEKVTKWFVGGYSPIDEAVGQYNSWRYYTEDLNQFQNPDWTAFRYFNDNETLIKYYNLSIGLTNAPCIVEFDYDDLERFETDSSDFHADYPDLDDEQRTKYHVYENFEDIPAPKTYRIWWYEPYQIRDIMHELMIDGFVRLDKAPEGSYERESTTGGSGSA